MVTDISFLEELAIFFFFNYRGRLNVCFIKKSSSNVKSDKHKVNEHNLPGEYHLGSAY